MSKQGNQKPLNVRTRIDFVKYVSENYQFFKIKNELYVNVYGRIVRFNSETAKHAIVAEYQNLLNDIVSSSQTLMENIRSRVESKELSSYSVVYKRVYQHENGIAYDLMQSNLVVDVTSRGYSIENKLSKQYYNLVSTQGAITQVFPQKSDKDLIDLIRPLTNFNQEDELILFVTWLVAALFPDYHPPILILLGEQGSGKSFTSQLAQRILDPSRTGKQHSITKPADVASLIDKNYVTVIDNLSGITDEISDMFCQTVSEGQYSRRKLYTDDELVTTDLRGQLILNGITIADIKPDLLERSIIFNLNKLTTSNTRPEVDLNHYIDNQLPFIMHSLFMVVSKAIESYPKVSLDSSYRMADFLRNAVAIGLALGLTQDEVIRLYEDNISGATSIAVADPVVDALLYVLSKHNNEFNDSATVLLNEMVESGINDLPSASNVLSRRLTRLSSNLASIGINIDKHKDYQGNRTLRIKKKI